MRLREMTWFRVLKSVVVFSCSSINIHPLAQDQQLSVLLELRSYQGINKKHANGRTPK